MLLLNNCCTNIKMCLISSIPLLGYSPPATQPWVVTQRFSPLTAIMGEKCCVTIKITIALGDYQALQNGILENFSVLGLTVAKTMANSNLRHLYGKSEPFLSSLAFMFCLDSNAYNFSSNENMILKLHTMTHFDTIFLVIQFSLWLRTFMNMMDRRSKKTNQD